MKCHTCGCEKIEALVSCYWCEDPVIKDALPLGDPRLMGPGRPLSEARPEEHGRRILLHWLAASGADIFDIGHWDERLERWYFVERWRSVICVPPKNAEWWQLPPVEEVR